MTTRPERRWTAREPLRDPPDEWLADAWARIRRAQQNGPEWVWPAADLASLPPLPAIAATPVPPPRKYQRLHQWFISQTAQRLVVSTSHIDELIDGGLPTAASKPGYSIEWWNNSPRKGHVRAWVNAGYVYVFGAAQSAGGKVFQRGSRRRICRAETILSRMGPLHHAQTCATDPHSSYSSDRPTSVYLLHLPDQGLFKVGISVNHMRRCRAHGGRGRRADILQVVQLEHRECAFALEAIALNLTEPWRMLDDPWRCGAGATETWRDTGPVPDLAALAARMRGGDAVQ